MISRAHVATAENLASSPVAAQPGMSAHSDHNRMANAIRALAMDAVEQAKSGHPGLPMGAADIATVLFSQFLKFDAADPHWPDRDRFVLSAGHGSMLIYALLHLLGYERMTIEELKRFRQLGSLTPGHPENFITPGVETTTGRSARASATPWVWRSPNGISRRNSAPISSIITPMCSHPTATSWKASARRRLPLPDICDSTG
jgi:hypothetical protein